MSDDHRPAHRCFAAIYDPATALAERYQFRPHREWLVADADGPTLDLGAGTGLTFPVAAETWAGSGPEPLHALEPDPHMRKRAAARATGLAAGAEPNGDRTDQSSEPTLDVALVAGTGDALPYPDDAFDRVVAGLVFCTIPDLSGTLEEVRRVLAPGGELRFLEHVAAEGWRGRLQALLAPAWFRAAGGCHLRREPDDAVDATGGLDLVEYDRLGIGVPPVQPVVRGRAVARE